MIKLTENIALSADERCFIIGRPREKAGKGRELLQAGYFASVSEALKYAVSLHLRDQIKTGQITTLRQLIDEQKQVQEHFARQLSETGVE